MSYEMLEKDQAYNLTSGQPWDGEITSKKFVELVVRVHERVLETSEATEIQALSQEERLRRAGEAISAILKDENLLLPTRLRRQIALEAVAEISGYGPIQPLLDDPTITEVMVNGPDQIYVERDGKIYKQDRMFKDAGHVMRVIERIVLPLGRRIDESSPMVDARLPDGSRVNAIIPPLAVDGPTLTVRKFSKVPYTGEDLVRFGTVTQWMLDFLQACVQSRLNVLISGGTGSGKTTSLNVLSSFVPEDERIVTIEDAAELQLQQEHVVRLESRPPNLEGKGEIPIRQLVRNSLRMRPDRIIVGEVRGGEALDMLQAMNTGHDGSLCTAHTNSPRDALSRLETMSLMAGTDLPSRAIREQIASAMNLIVHQARLRDGSRKIVQVSEVQGMEGDVIVLQDIFIFDQQGVDATGKVIGEHKPTGLRPQFIARLAKQGIDLPVEIFRTTR